mgnify:CR=1 FL=1
MLLLSSLFHARICKRKKRLKFHLFIPLCEPEQDLSLSLRILQKEDSTNFSYTPIALLLLQNNGVNWANHVLTKSSSRLDEQIVNQLTDKTKQF